MYFGMNPTNSSEAEPDLIRYWESGKQDVSLVEQLYLDQIDCHSAQVVMWIIVLYFSRGLCPLQNLLRVFQERHVDHLAIQGECAFPFPLAG